MSSPLRTETSSPAGTFPTMSWASDRVHGYRVHGLSLAPLNTPSPPRAGPWVPHSQAPGHDLSEPPLRLLGFTPARFPLSLLSSEECQAGGWSPPPAAKGSSPGRWPGTRCHRPGTRAWTRQPAAQYGLGVRMTSGLTLAHGELAAGTWEDDEGDSQDFSACPAPSQRAPSQPGALGFGGGKTTNLTEA